MSTSTTDTLRSTISGRVLEEGDEGFSAFPFPLAAPALVVTPKSADEVAAAIEHAKANDLPISIRSGGHSGGMWTTAPGGLVIDVSALSDVAPDGTKVTVGSGATWGAVAAALAPHHLVVSSGDTSTVGVAGLTLGGGFGWFVRTHGLAIDSLVSARVVTADSELVTASATENADLFWALRGGGGNFGVVVDFTFEARPLEGVVHGQISYDNDDLGVLLRGFRDALRDAPEELNATFMLMPPMGPTMPGGPQVHVVWAGTDEAQALAAIQPLLDIPGFTRHDIAAKPYAAVLQELEGPPPGAPVPTIVGNNGFAKELDDEVVDALVTLMGGLDAGILMIRYLGGAFNRVSSDSTAFAWRDAGALVITAAFLPPGAAQELVDGVNRAWQPVAAHMNGAYGNFITYSNDSVLALMYPPATLARLAEVKSTWDPANLFNQNQNVRPA